MTATETSELTGLIDPVDGVQLERDWRRSVRSDHTRAAYTADLQQFYGWCVSERVDPSALTRGDGDRFRDWLTGPQFGGRDGRYGKATIARKLTAVSSLYGYVKDVRPDLLAANPWDQVGRPRVSSKSRTRWLSVQEGDRLLDAAADDSPAALAIVDLMLSTGVRTTEVITAMASDLFRDGPDVMLRVTRKGGEEDDVCVPEATALLLREYLDGRTTGPLFLLPRTGARALSRQQVQRLIAKLARKAGLTGDVGERMVSPHSLRHTAATQAFDQEGVGGRNVQHMLGHKDRRTTDRYDGGAEEAKRVAARKLGELWHRDR